MSLSAFRMSGPRAVRLSALALAAGAAAGIAAAGDIRSSYRVGRIGAPALVSTVPAAPAADDGAADPALAYAHGFALAAQRGIDRLPECRSIAIAFRRGCEDYVADRASAVGAAVDIFG
ncbi:MAG TPA: hypothetical protein VF702_04420 [Allosphingosinicella sp.]